jgi:hypothetical protein
MELKLVRYAFSSVCSIGDLLVNGEYFCKTLEDTDRKLECDGVKLYGKTAIPRGTYSVILDWSPRFQRELPHVLDVPGFAGIRIHPGNKAEDTEGCILVGSNVVSDNFIANSRQTFAQLFTRLEEAYERNEEISLEIS